MGDEGKLMKSGNHGDDIYVLSLKLFKKLDEKFEKRELFFI